MSINIQGISKISGIENDIKTSKPDGDAFKNMYNSALDMINETNQLQKDADQMGIDFALGKNDNVSDLMIAQEKASIALQYTVQIRDKVLEAYNQIMRMQV